MPLPRYPPAVAKLENRLTWSKSRAETFAHCLRKYWWTYYGSWGGWSSDAPREAREAYVLKNLNSRWTWVGGLVHGAIEDVLRRVQGAKARGELDLDGGTALDPEVEVDRVTRRMRQEFRDSRDGRYRADPKRIVGLVEHEYATPVPDAEWKEMNRRAVEGVRNFLASDLFAAIRASDPATWLPFETLDSFDFEGTPVWAALDFAKRTSEGAEVYDWKTGDDRVEENRLQLVCYALYVEAKHGVPATSVRCRLYYVNSGTIFEWTPTAADLDAAKASMRESIAEMRRRLQAGGPPEPNRLAFPMTEDLAKCSSCAFRRPCGR